MPPETSPDPQQVADIAPLYKALEDALDKAYWAATTIEAKDRIYGASDAVHEILTEIDKKKFETDTAEMATLLSRVKQTNAALKKLQDDIDALVHKIQVAADVVNDIASVIAFAGKFV